MRILDLSQAVSPQPACKIEDIPVGGIFYDKDGLLCMRLQDPSEYKCTVLQSGDVFNLTIGVEVTPAYSTIAVNPGEDSLLMDMLPGRK